MRICTEVSTVITLAETKNVPRYFYRAMHFSAKRGIAIACRLSVCLSGLSVTLGNCDHIGWNSSKIISPLVSLFATLTWRVCSKGNTAKFGPKVTHPLLNWALETFNCKLQPNGYTQRYGHNGEPIGNHHCSFEWCRRWPPATSTPTLHPKKGGFHAPNIHEWPSLQRVIRSTSCLVLG